MQRRFFINSVFLIMLIFILVGCKETAEVEYELKSQEIKSADSLTPDFNLPTLEGGQITLSELRGKVVVIDFWATWCPPCREEIPGFIKLYDQYKDEGLEIIGISLDTGEKSKLSAFVKEWKINYPIVIGDDNVTRDYGGIRAIPTTFIIDKKGAIREKHIGYTLEKIFKEEIERLLKE